MTSQILTPWWRDRSPRGNGASVSGSTEPTKILDWRADPVAELINATASPAGDSFELDLLRRAHGEIAHRVRPVYSVMDERSVSRTLSIGRGSCSQRLAVLEAVARGSGVATRVRGLLVDGRFWYPRFRRIRPVVPDKVLLAWPEFLIDSNWVEVSELFGKLDDLSALGSSGFTNSDGETLFEAIACTAVDWDGLTRDSGGLGYCDLSTNVIADLGRFESRDELFQTFGQTLSWPARMAAEPILGRWSA